MVALILPVFWSSRKLTSLRGPSASALSPLTIFRSLSALQLCPHCTQMRHPLQKSQRCCIPAQHRRARMTRPPTYAAPLLCQVFRSSYETRSARAPLLPGTDFSAVLQLRHSLAKPFRSSTCAATVAAANATTNLFQKACTCGRHRPVLSGDRCPAAERNTII